MLNRKFYATFCYISTFIGILDRDSVRLTHKKDFPFSENLCVTVIHYLYLFGYVLQSLLFDVALIHALVES